MTEQSPPPTPGVDDPSGPYEPSTAEASDERLGSMTVEDELTPDPAERDADPSGQGQADDLQADEARDPTG